MGDAVAGSTDVWDSFAGKLRNAGEDGQELLTELEPLRRQSLDQQAAARNLAPG